MPATRKIIVIGDLHNYPGTCFRIYFAYTIQRRYVKQDVLHPYLCYILIIPTVTSQRTYYIHTYAVLLLYLQRPQTRLTTYLPMLYSYHTIKTSTSKHRWLELEPQNLLKGRESFTFSRQQLSEQI